MLNDLLLLVSVLLLTVSVFAQDVSNSPRSKKLPPDWQVGISVPGFRAEYDQKEIDEIKAAGFDCVELSLPVSKLSHNQQRVWIKDFAAKCQKAKLAVRSVHIPFSQRFDISSLKKENRETMIAESIFLFDCAEILGAKFFVIHSSSEPIKDQDRPIQIENAVKTLRLLTDKAHEKGLRLAMENLPRTCLANTAAELNKILQAAGPDVDWCFDSNHLLQEKPEEFVARADRVMATTHISDYDFIDERHWVPYEGKINWNNVMSELVKKGYEGPIVFECRRKADGTKLNYRQMYDIWLKLQKDFR